MHPHPSPGLFYSALRPDSVGSTNDEARVLADQGAPEGTMVVARRQVSGRGRRGRQWISGEGNFYASLILRPHCSPEAAAQVSFVAGVAVADAVAQCLEEAGGRASAVRCKWPNDVLVDGRKVAGLLLESDIQRGGGTKGAVGWVIVGVGINVAHHPAETERPATSLATVCVGSPAVAMVERAFCESLTRWYDVWSRSGFAPIRQAWLDRAVGIGKSAEVRLQRETLEGVFRGLDADGTLLLEGAGGVVRRVAAGDLYFPGLVGDSGPASHSGPTGLCGSS